MNNCLEEVQGNLNWMRGYIGFQILEPLKRMLQIFANILIYVSIEANSVDPERTAAISLIWVYAV